MKLSERSIKIKELITGQVDMGTFGLVELELIEFDKELSELKKLRVADVSGRSELLIDFAIKNGYFQDIPKGQKEGLIDRFEKSINCR